MPMSSLKVIKEDTNGCVEPSTVSGISAFLGKLWKMVEDPKTDDLIAWGQSGNSFVIKNQIDFAKTILPNYYKHNNIASFIRQLNMYGFHKIISTTSGALDSTDNDEIEFTHPNFVRGQPYLLEQIKRKMNNPKENIVKSENGPGYNDSLKRVLVDIKHLKGKQESLSSQFCAVKQENEILWRELSLLRQKHAAQQNILNKLIRFLVSLAQPANHSMAKRRLIAPLMLKDARPASQKQVPVIESGDHVYTMKKRMPKSPGPTIHEIHSSDAMNDVIINSPGSEVPDDASLLVESDLEACAESDISIPDEVTTTSPVPAALLRSDMRGKKRIQKVYVTPDQRASSHFLASPASTRDRMTSEYLIPEQTDNPFLELVHETEADNDEYITVLADDAIIDDPEILAESIPDAGLNSGTSLLTTVERGGRRKQPASRRKSAASTTTTTGRTNVTQPQSTNAPRQRVKQTSRRKAEQQQQQQQQQQVSRREEPPSNTIQTDDFLYNINLQTEPLTDTRSPKPNTSATGAETVLPEFIVLTGTSPNSNLQIDIPLTAEEMSTISPNVDAAANSMNVNVAPNLLLSPHSPMVSNSPASNSNLITPISPRPSPSSISPRPSPSPISPAAAFSPLNLVSSPITPLSPPTPMSPNTGTSQYSQLSSGAVVTGQPISPGKMPEQNLFTNQMNECIDNAQNMRIACTTDTNQGYAPENFRNQLDGIQTDINSLKEMMQHTGVKFDVNTLMGLFSEDPMDYNMPTSNPENVYRSNDDKITGNEVIAASNSPLLDFSDIFADDWNLATPPMSAYEDYYTNTLNTPQIEGSMDDLSLVFPPPSKKIKSNEETK